MFSSVSQGAHAVQLVGDAALADHRRLMVATPTSAAAERCSMVVLPYPR
jgi:hypothetical protein